MLFSASLHTMIIFVFMPGFKQAKVYTHRTVFVRSGDVINKIAKTYKIHKETETNVGAT